MPEDPTLLDRLAEAADAEEAMAGLMFHGTAEPLDGPLRPGGYDGVFWTADNPAVAQNYIPRSGGSALVQVQGYELRDRVRPSMHSAQTRAAVIMSGTMPDVEWGTDGRARSWTIPPGWPTNGELLEWFRETLGYEDARPDRGFWAMTRGVGETLEFLPADHRMPGQLMICDLAGLRLFDAASGREGDLQDPDHKDLDLFRRVEARGWDGIVINDFCQSPVHGNVGHRSWGVFASAMDRVRWAAVPAVHFDWGTEPGALRQRLTPEFEEAVRLARETGYGPPGP